jgi:hypothetical protein
VTRNLYLLLTACLLCGILAAAEQPAAEGVLLVRIGGVTLHPSAFVDAIGMTRSATTPDSVSTGFGSIPLSSSPEETITSARHSRLMLTGDRQLGSWVFSAYLESDFMNVTAGQSPYRWRQYWGQAKFGRWELLGGQAWSLMRPNRVGFASDKDVMNTDVIDPAYHVGLLGSRRRQIRLGYNGRTYKAVAAWENTGNFVAKVMRDRNRLHLELAGFTGHRDHRGVSPSAVLGLTSRLRLVTGQYWGKRSAEQVVGGLPSGHNGLSTLEGAEAQVRKSFEVYAYAGWAYAARSGSNRLVREWTLGVNQKERARRLFGNVLLSLQYSRVDRALWVDRTGQMDYLMYRVRYTFN